MSKQESEYDVLVVGTGASGMSAVDLQSIGVIFAGEGSAQRLPPF